MFIHYWERERNWAWTGEGQREGKTQIWSRLQALSCQHRARRGAQTHKSWDHDLSQSGTLKWLSYQVAPPPTVSFLRARQGRSQWHDTHSFRTTKEELGVSMWLFPGPQSPCVLPQSPWLLLGPPSSQVMEATSLPSTLGSWLGHQGLKIWLSTCFPAVAGNSRAPVKVSMSSFSKQDSHPLWSGPELKHDRGEGDTGDVVPFPGQGCTEQKAEGC